MAIGLANHRYVGRSTGGNACNSSAYNARGVTVDQNTNIKYNWTGRDGNVHHEVMLPDFVDEKFKNINTLSNEVEACENRKNSQLYVEWVIALPKEEEVTLEMKKEIVRRFIEAKGWIKEGLGVQADVHKPDEDNINWHSHVLVTTRRFRKDGLGLEDKKARDLQPEVRNGKVDNTLDHLLITRIQNDYFKECGLDLRVDLPGKITQKHIGAKRMRQALSLAVEDNELRKESNIESLSSGENLLNHVTKHNSVFTESDLRRSLKPIFALDAEAGERILSDALSSRNLLKLVREGESPLNKPEKKQGETQQESNSNRSENNTGAGNASREKYLNKTTNNQNNQSKTLYTTREVRVEEQKLLRLSHYIAKNNNVFTSSDGAFKGSSRANKLNSLLQLANKSLKNDEQKAALSHAINSKSGISVIRGRAGVGKSYVLGHIADIATKMGVEVIGLAPTHKAKGELASRGFDKADTIKGMLFKLKNDRIVLPKNSLIVIDEAGMVGNEDFAEILRVAASYKCHVILSGDERQLASIGRGGMFEEFAKEFGSSAMVDIQRQKNEWGRLVATHLSKGEVRSAVNILNSEKRIKNSSDAISSKALLLKHWSESKEEVHDKLILAVKNKDVDSLNRGAREYMKASGKLTGEEISVSINSSNGAQVNSADNVSISKQYMSGDRIVIKETNKKLGVTNGDFGYLTHVSEGKFTIALDKDKVRAKDQTNEHNKTNQNEISFDPSKYSGFNHGYAATIYKAQGASILSVFVFHDGFAGIRNSYVALSRNIKELGFYVNKNSTKSINHLIKQLGFDPEISSSISFKTTEDLEKESLEKQDDIKAKDYGLFRSAARTIFKEVGSKIGEKVTELTDKHIKNSEYYKFTPPIASNSKVEKAINSYHPEEEAVENHKETHSEASHTHIEEQEERLVANSSSGVGSSNMIAAKSGSYYNKESKTKLSPKDKFYARADRSRSNNITANLKGLANKNLKNKPTTEELKAHWKQEHEHLRHEARFKCESIALSLLGEPNRKISNDRDLRYGSKGALSIRISGEKAGTWHDFESGNGGDIFSLVQDRNGGDFKSSVEYVRSHLGISSNRLEGSSRSNNSALKLVHDYNSKERLAAQVKESEQRTKEEAKKAAFVQKLYNRSKSLMDRSVATRYLKNHRGIDLTNSHIENPDIKTAGIYQRNKTETNQSSDSKNISKNTNNITSGNTNNKDNKGHYLPALIAFARDASGNITGGQHIVLDKRTAGKANVDIPKKSFGKISGSFVDVGTIESDHSTTGSNNNQNKASNHKQITIIAEGLETALSVRQSLENNKDLQKAAYSINDHTNHTINIKCSLGIGNISTYKPADNEHIIIAADNDGVSSNTEKTIDTAKEWFEKNGTDVQIVRPNKEGDFNDMLIADSHLKQKPEKGTDATKSANEQKIASSFTGAIGRATAKTIEGYFAHHESGKPIDEVMSKLELSDLALLKKYNQSEEKITNAYRESHSNGKSELDAARRSILKTEFNYKENKHIIDEGNQWATEENRSKGLISDHDHIKANIGKSEDAAKEYTKDYRDEHLISHITINMNQLNEERYSFDFNKQKEAVKKEHHFMKNLYESLENKNIDSYKLTNTAKEVLENGERCSKNTDLIDRFEKAANYIHKNNIAREDQICSDMRYSKNLDHVVSDLENQIDLKRTFSVPRELGEKRQATKTIDSTLIAITKEQDYLASLHNNSGMEHDEKALYSFKAAKENKDNNVHGKLEHTVNELIAHIQGEAVNIENTNQENKENSKNSIITKDYILSKLQGNIDIDKIHKILDAKLEYIKIDQSLKNINKNKEKVLKPEDLTSHLKEKQSFLSSLKDKIKYPDALHKENKELTDGINHAHDNQSKHTDMINQTNRLIEETRKNEGFSDDHILKTMQSGDSHEHTIEHAHANLLSSHHESILNRTNHMIDQIHDGHTVHVDHHEFDCAVKMMDHMIEHHAHKEFMPHQELSKIHHEAIEHQKEHEHDHSHGYGGYSM